MSYCLYDVKGLWQALAASPLLPPRRGGCRGLRGAPVGGDALRRLAALPRHVHEGLALRLRQARSRSGPKNEVQFLIN